MQFKSECINFASVCKNISSRYDECTATEEVKVEINKDVKFTDPDSVDCSACLALHMYFMLA